MPVEVLVLVAAMIPAPGETGEEWWTNTGWTSAKEDDSPTAVFYHDVPLDLAARALEQERGQSATPMRQPWPLEAWPDVPTRFLLCSDDRMFGAGWLRNVVRDRLGITADEIDGGHCVYLSRPQELADHLEAYASGAE